MILLLKTTACSMADVFPVISQATQVKGSAFNTLPMDRTGLTTESPAKDPAPLGANIFNLIDVKVSERHALICKAIDNGCDTHRTHDPVHGTWKGDPLCFSTIDIFSKRSPLAPTSAIVPNNTAGGTIVSHASQVWPVKRVRMENVVDHRVFAVIASPGNFVKTVDGNHDQIVLEKVNPVNVAAFGACYCWDMAARFTDSKERMNHVSEVVHGLASPVVVKVIMKN